MPATGGQDAPSRGHELPAEAPEPGGPIRPVEKHQLATHKHTSEILPSISNPSEPIVKLPPRATGYTEWNPTECFVYERRAKTRRAVRQQAVKINFDHENKLKHRQEAVKTEQETEKEAPTARQVAAKTEQETEKEAHTALNADRANPA